MTSGIGWSEQFKDPRWQKMRLEVLESAGWECIDCGSKDKTLHVHHSYYEKGKAPWEYPINSLHCLCEDCHKKAQDLHTELKRQIGALDLSAITQLLGYVRSLQALRDPETIIDVLDYEMAEGVADLWRLTPEDVINALRETTIDGKALAELGKGKGKRHA